MDRKKDDAELETPAELDDDAAVDENGDELTEAGTEIPADVDPDARPEV